MSGQTIDLADLVKHACRIARAAGEAILQVYRSDFAVEQKLDRSPLTEADLAAHHIIVNALRALTPELPILSEESASLPWSERSSWTRYWLVDPLDGTREFVKRNGEFTVNIALIDAHQTVLGVVYAPVLDEMYFAWAGAEKTGGAFAQHTGEAESRRLHTRSRPPTLIVAGSRSHADVRQQAALQKIGEHELQALGSSLKFCRIAEAKADLYLRHGPTSEWDTAAAQCVLEQAGGGVCQFDGTPLRYNRGESLLNPEFFAFGDPAVRWQDFLH
ncbi:3'(2'),5'-bisphosphate nucleotidase [Pseudolysobacter antarcticus]|uniref:3'(2'),5'-bisphosphate nucleotidase CysQ n=1 Tax=Pseudolysobacter antarcticus TaxID=2511995 RepID=A0A411HMK9_9GAMM|nr:3'(2'),5'-bisphosphate nucleotidase CysQ [Pseudolysobacter antarcticus]QBB71719.1 3'(2'),5'-bisphosphate nucleotidase [Pseudolysobacter antarcticus]